MIKDNDDKDINRRDKKSLLCGTGWLLKTLARIFPHKIAQVILDNMSEFFNKVINDVSAFKDTNNNMSVVGKNKRTTDLLREKAVERKKRSKREKRKNKNTKFGRYCWLAALTRKKSE